MAGEGGAGGDSGIGEWLSQGTFMFRQGVDPREFSDAMVSSGDGAAPVDVAALAKKVVAPSPQPALGGVAPTYASPWPAKRAKLDEHAGVVAGPPPQEAGAGAGLGA